MKNSRFKLGKMIAMTVLTTSFVASSAYAGGFFDHWRHRGGDMMMPIERMIDHVDLTESQAQQTKDILDKAHQQTKSLQDIRHRFAKQMLINNPDAANYMSTAEQQAEAIAAEVKDKILLMAKVRQEIYQILTPEQKDELETHIEKMMKRMSKKMEHHRYND